MRECILIAAFTAWNAAGQTQIDLRTQTKSMDFSAASSTKPVRTGTTLPDRCTAGELFLNLTAAVGANVFACTSPDVWSVQGKGDPLSLKNSGAVVGARGTVNFIPGPGLTSIMTDTGSQVNVQLGLDSAVIQTQPGEQSGSDLLCASAGTAGASYRCALNPTATSYTRGMSLHWIPDVAGAGGPTTLNIDTLGAVPVKMADGTTDPRATSIAAGQLYAIWFDGSSFRLPPEGNLGAATFEIHLPLAICTAPSTGTLLWSSPPFGATAAVAGGCSGTSINDAYAVFGIGGAPSLQFSVTLPQNLTGNAAVSLSYLTDTPAGTFTPALDVVCTATNGTGGNDAPFPANNFFAPGSTVAPSNASQLQTLSMNAIAWPAGCTAGQRAHFRLMRTDTNGTAADVSVAEVVIVGMRSL